MKALFDEHGCLVIKSESYLENLALARWHETKPNNQQFIIRQFEKKEKKEKKVK